MVENFIQKKAGLLHHARGARGQKLGDAPLVKTVRARVFKKDAHNSSYKKIFCVRVLVDESEKLEPNWDGEIAILDDF